ncbi:hypothetical protein L6452_05216 [Arctium lappa]|uniref:Uncharacterized protein n=1 Tax=Arctium lappa TaxID=4217 RepID=A0ACB9EF73_ARCLA|nr:hypothetical protein L6452_05216 [Arctium lappa]
MLNLPNTPHEHSSPIQIYCFCIPYRWRKVSSSEAEEVEIRPNGITLWSRGVAAFKKIREWSEIVVGPRWKTFIRCFKHSNTFVTQSSKFQTTTTFSGGGRFGEEIGVKHMVAVVT